MPITVLMVLSGLFMLFFYNSVMGLPSALVGIGLSSSLVVDALLDPFIGHLSDRTRHWLGAAAHLSCCRARWLLDLASLCFSARRAA